MENICWKNTVGTLIGFIWLYMSASVAASVVGVLNGIMNPGGVREMIESFVTGSASRQPDMGDLIRDMFSVVMLIGYFLFARLLTRFIHLQSHQQDAEHLSSVRVAYILMFVACIPVLGGWIGFALMIVGYIKMLSGYYGLMHSVTFPPEAKAGVSTLYVCTFWLLAGCVVGCIPLVGDAIEGLITSVVLFVVTSAWKRIQNAAPDMTAEEEGIFRHREMPVHKWVLGDALVMVLFLDLIHVMSNMVCQEFLRHSSWFFLGYSVFWSLIYMSICVWLLRSRQVCSRLVAKIGLVVLLLRNLLAVFLSFVLTRPAIFSHFPLVDESCSLIAVCYIVGVFLFILYTDASLPLKIVVMAYAVVTQVIWGSSHILRLQETSADLSDARVLLACSYNACPYTTMGVMSVALAFVCYFVIRWRRQYMIN